MRINQHDDSGKVVGSMKLAPSILTAPVMTVEQRRASLLLSALSDVEKMGSPQKSRDVCDAQAEARDLRADIRHLRRILDVFTSEMKKQMEPPILGESIESLRAKRSMHLCAADSALREYIAKHKPIDIPATQKISAPATVPSEISTDLRKRILAGGILALCLLSLFWTDYRDRKVIGLTELVALCGSWACAVWLWKWKYPWVGRGARWLLSIVNGLWKVFSWTLALWMVFYLICRQNGSHERAVIAANAGIPIYLFLQYLVWLALDSSKD